MLVIPFIILAITGLIVIFMPLYNPGAFQVKFGESPMGDLLITIVILACSAIVIADLFNAIPY